MTRTIHPTLATVGLLSALGAGCDEAQAPRADNACVRGPATSSLDAEIAPGPFPVGTLRLDLVDATRTTPAYETYAGDTVRTLDTRIHYPAVAEGAGVDAAAGQFPVVLYAHGFSSSNGENIQLARHLASHGYIVAAPEFPLSTLNAPAGPTGIDIAEQPRDESFVLDTVLGFSTQSGHPLEGAVDADRVAAVGLSMGGLTTLLLTYHVTLRDPRVDVAVALAPVGDVLGEQFYTTTNTPLLVLFGDADAILSYDPHATSVFARAQAPVSLARLVRGTHTGFTTVAVLFEETPGYEHIDALGCNALGGGGGGGGNDPPDLTVFNALGGAEAGLVVPSGEGTFCPADLGIGMLPSRQLTLTDAAVRSFLDSYLSADATRRGEACTFHERTLGGEADVVVSRR